MRITTKMLNETAARTGIPVNQSSLLDYINGDDTAQDTLLDTLNKNHKVSGITTDNYKKLKKSADALKEQAEKFAAAGEDSFFEKIKASGDKEELGAAVSKYVENYNATLSDLGKAPGILNDYYGQMLKEAAEDSSSQLADIGISIGKDGKMSIDQEKLNAASVEQVEKVFGPSGALTAKFAFIAGRISDNAQAGMQSASSQYDGSGNLYSQLTSRYDFFG